VRSENIYFLFLKFSVLKNFYSSKIYILFFVLIHQMSK